MSELREIRAKMQRLADLLIAISAKLNDVIAETGRSDFLEFLAENTRDCMWQIKEEVLHNVDRNETDLFPNSKSTSEFNKSRAFCSLGH